MVFQVHGNFLPILPKRSLPCQFAAPVKPDHSDGKWRSAPAVRRRIKFSRHDPKWRRSSSNTVVPQFGIAFSWGITPMTHQGLYGRYIYTYYRVFVNQRSHHWGGSNGLMEASIVPETNGFSDVFPSSFSPLTLERYMSIGYAHRDMLHLFYDFFFRIWKRIHEKQKQECVTHDDIHW